ncbi:MAG: efflux RND transporter permease subunit [Planctomycetes bacterium]|nr:efflux RND transporter permease subunit [Planctomycetota bacterium]
MSDPTAEPASEPLPEQRSAVGRLIGFFLENKLVVGLMLAAIVAAGLMVAPFDWNLDPLPRSPVPTDAIPDIGENQQLVFTAWPGRSPQDIEDQVTYPLTAALAGIPGVRTIRSNSMFGFSSIYVIFEEFSAYERLVEGKDFYWTRSRILEKLNSLPSDTLPAGVQPALGPDATALGQIFWYTLEGRDEDGRPAGGWDPQRLRTIQDWYVRYGLASAGGVAEVASVGGFVREYQVDVDPDAMRAYGVALHEVFHAVQASNVDVGARSIEMNRVEYLIRGIGFIKDLGDIENSVVAVHEGVPVLVKHVARVTTGPALRRGALDKAGAEAVGGVVVARYGANPLATIQNVKAKIAEIAPGLPSRVHIDFARTTPEAVRRFADAHGFQAYAGDDPDETAWLAALRALPRDQRPDWATISQVAIVPFYDRTGLIYETLGTLNRALAQEILITLIVVIVMVLHLRSSMLIGSMLPLAVLLCFIAMRTFGVDANIVALSGIAIAIGTIVDMGIVISENILRHEEEAPPGADRLALVHRAASEVGGAVLTAVLTTVVSFLPVFFMIGSEGKLFRPLAFTKTFALVASVVIALTVLPALAHTLFGLRVSGRRMRRVVGGLLIAAGAGVGVLLAWWTGVIVAAPGVYLLVKDRLPALATKVAPWAANLAIAAVVVGVLSAYWEPLGPERGLVRNVVFVGGLVGGVLGFFRLVQYVYPWVLTWCLGHKVVFLALVGAVLVLGLLGWIGVEGLAGPASEAAERLGVEPATLRSTNLWVAGSRTFPGLGREFMPPLDEGSFLWMPTTMVHASLGECLDVLAKQDQALSAIPEVESVVGKIGRVESPLDPAPISMIETVVNYKSEYVTDKAGRRLTFRYDAGRGAFVRDAEGRLIPDPSGRPFRQWRDHIRSPDDIWDELVAAARIPGTTSAPKLQPIAARLVMLQSGMRAPMGVKVKATGTDLRQTLATIEAAGLEIERLLKQVPGVRPETVIADRIVGKPYLEIVPDRVALARYGVPIRAFQDVVEVAIGGRPATTTVEGRERFPVRVRYQRELRDRIETLGRILVPGAEGAQVPLEQVAEVRYVAGPQSIKSEDTFLVGYVVFDKQDGWAEVDVVEACRRHLEAKRAAGEFVLPAGVTYDFAGAYQQQVRSQRTLAVILPVALFVIFLILYFQFRSVPTTLLVFTGIFVAWSGGFILLWLYGWLPGQSWFSGLAVFGVNLQDLFQVHPVNLSVAVWVGFLALFGIATDDGVIMATYLDQRFRADRPTTVADIRAATVAGGSRRVRACLMTTATTVLALVPVLTSVGRGADVLVPMAIPSFGGMTLEVLTMFVVPVLYAAVQEFKRHTGIGDGALGAVLLVTGPVGFFAVAAYCAVHDLVARVRGT